MDSRQDEQEKRITMKSSSISLMFQPRRALTLANSADSRNATERTQSQSGNDSAPHPYLINLIDSPGHVDFSSEVSSAARLTDGALVLIDVVEGVSTQTRSVLMQAFKEKVKPCLVLNKIDRLITERQLTPAETYKQLSRILEEVNVLMSTLAAAQLFQSAEESDKQTKKQQQQRSTVDSSAEGTDEGNTRSSYSIEGFDENLDSEAFFSPAKGNVAFASAFDGWAFRVNHFAELFSKKLGMKRELLQKTLWGEYYLNKKTKRVMRRPSSKGAQDTMFVSFIMQNIHEIYSSIFLYPYDSDKIEKILSKFGMTSESVKRLDRRQQMQKIMSTWLPLSDAVLEMVVEHLPNPIEAQRNRILKLIPELTHNSLNVPVFAGKTSISKAVNRNERAKMREYRRKLKRNLVQCDASETAEVMVFVSKMLEVDTLPSAYIHKQVFRPKAFDRKLIVAKGGVLEFGSDDSDETDSVQASSDTKDGDNSVVVIGASEEGSASARAEQQIETAEQHFVGFARIFSGTIRPGQKLQILGPRYNALNPNEHRVEITVDKLYLLMGRSLEYVEEVPAGNIFGISGISEHILKSATIASSPYAPIFTAMYQHVAPIVKIAVEPKHVSDMPALIHGMKLLNQSDPSVEAFVTETGEHVIMTSGEVHAERCLRDLREKFANIEIEFSPPLVSFKETIVSTEGIKQEPVIVSTADKSTTLHIRAIPLPLTIARFIDENSDRLRKLADEEMIDSEYDTFEVYDELRQRFEEAGKEWAARWDRVWSLGPRRFGPNVLLNNITEYSSPFFKPLSSRIRSSFESTEGAEGGEDGETAECLSTASHNIKRLAQFDSSIVTGFQIATLDGPLCGEPMWGVCFIIDSIDFGDVESDNEGGAEVSSPYGSVGGQLISAVSEGCRRTFENSSRRLVEAMYRCEMQATQDALGQAYAVLRKRRARVINEVLEEGSGLFNISSYLPVAESFGFAVELRTKTSGQAQPQLAFSHWEILDVDPFFFPKTEEEIEEFGEYEDKAPNIARDYIDEVRTRKGLQVRKQLVEAGEKQRTLARKK